MDKDTAEISAAKVREVRFEHSRHFAALLQQLGASLLISTYQAGKLVTVGTRRGALDLAFSNFERTMGVAVKPERVAIGAQSQVWFLRSAPDIAPKLEPAGAYDACYLTRSSHYTGDIQGHELAWSGDELWVVNTLFSCLCTLHADFSFVPRWRPVFISDLAAEDRCHLNGMALDQGKPKYVTAMAQSDSPRGWRPVKVTDGCLIDVERNAAVACGFAMPHSPRLHEGKVWLLDSGRGQLVRVNPENGTWDRVVDLPGYTRGLAFLGAFAFVGLSRIRETSTFGGVPIADNRDSLKCGVAIVDLRAGEAVASLEFKSGVEEIFDVQVLPNTRLPAVSGPHAAAEGGRSIWIVPQPEKK